MKRRTSYGIACCRFNGENPEIVLVCKRYTYAYSMFVHGKYKSNDNEEIRGLLNGMTTDEKHDLLSFSFTQIWYRIWLDSNKKTTFYFVSKNKFETTFLLDDGARLRKLISKSTHADRVWEIPKGRKKNKYEPQLECAIREFQEETGIEKKRYRLIPDAVRSYSYEDDNTIYTNVYYLAVAPYNINLRVNFGLKEQIDEISDIKWIGAAELRYIDKIGTLTNFCSQIFKFVRMYSKGRVLKSDKSDVLIMNKANHALPDPASDQSHRAGDL
jgi:8-oxo-dGTP pyrophosphatase MutT (NUDIX family)